MSSHLFTPPRPNYAPLIERERMLVAARLRDYGTAQTFTLQASPPAQPADPEPMFDIAPTTPEPADPRQLTLGV